MQGRLVNYLIINSDDTTTNYFLRETFLHLYFVILVKAISYGVCLFALCLMQMWLSILIDSDQSKRIAKCFETKINV